MKFKKKIKNLNLTILRNQEINNQLVSVDRYNFKVIEEKWQKEWENKKTFSSKVNRNKKKFY